MTTETPTAPAKLEPNEALADRLAKVAFDPTAINAIVAELRGQEPAAVPTETAPGEPRLHLDESGAPTKPGPSTPPPANPVPKPPAPGTTGTQKTEPPKAKPDAPKR